MSSARASVPRFAEIVARRAATLRLQQQGPGSEVSKENVFASRAAEIAMDLSSLARFGPARSAQTINLGAGIFLADEPDPP
jgi:hypothetical protein